MDVNRTGPTSVVDRVRKHRELQKRRDVLAAVAAARLALGMPPGDHARVLAAHLKKISKIKDIPEAYVDLLDEAARFLSRRR